jgi:hypothetical protein
MVIRGAFKQTAKFLFLNILSIIWKRRNLAVSTTGNNFDEFKIGRAA